MADPETTLQVHEFSVCTFLDCEKIVQAIKDEYLEFTENVAWTRASQMLDELRGNDVSLPVILVDSTSEQRGVMAWGVARTITIEGELTRVRLENVGDIPSWPVVGSLFCESTGESLLESDKRPNQIVETPPFIIEEPRTYVLTWNPNRRAGEVADKVPIEFFEELRSQILNDLIPMRQWTCHSVKKVRAGDLFIMLRTGDAPRGVVGWGWIRSNGRIDEDGWKHVDILWKWVFDPDEPLDLQTLPGMESFRAPQGSGVGLDASFHDMVWKTLNQRVDYDIQRFDENTSESDSTPSTSVPQPTSSSPPSELAEDTASSLEGRLIETWSTRRERDAKNRALCLEVHEYRCVVCEMSFLEEYGEIGRDFIHVHHEHPLASSDADNGTVYVPASDMKPVCPNCHAMLHRGRNAQRGEVRSITELRAIRAHEKTARLIGVCR